MTADPQVVTCALLGHDWCRLGEGVLCCSRCLLKKDGERTSPLWRAVERWQDAVARFGTRNIDYHGERNVRDT